MSKFTTFLLIWLAVIALGVGGIYVVLKNFLPQPTTQSTSTPEGSVNLKDFKLSVVEGNLFVENPDGSNQRQLTFDQEVTIMGNRSPDGRFVLFRGPMRKDIEEAFFDNRLHLLDVLTGEQKLVAEELPISLPPLIKENDLIAVNGVFSPVENRIAYITAGNRIFVVNPDGTNFSSLLLSPFVITKPIRWTEDGVAIEFTYLDTRIPGNPEKTALVEVPALPFVAKSCQHPSFGSQQVDPRMLEVSLENDTVFVRASNGSDDAQPLTCNNEISSIHSRSPDGRFIIVSTHTRDRGSVFPDINESLINVLTGEKRLVAENTDLRASDAAFSPIDNRIAFISRDDKLYLINPDGSNLKPLVTDLEVYYGVIAWSPDGKEIAFSVIDMTQLPSPTDIYSVSGFNEGLGTSIERHTTDGNSINPRWTADEKLEWDTIE
ncbi:MAG: hypothetical protein HY459_02710 [Parcubacteria group bacterium]|nr:hypothetical protein [Parcubacteria group bacterium]